MPRPVPLPWLRSPRLLPHRVILLQDAGGAALLLVLTLLPLGIPGVDLGELPARDAPAWLALLLIVAQTLGLAVRRLYPAAALLVVGLAFAAAQLGAIETGLAGLGVFVAIYSFAAYQQRRRLVYGAAGVIVYVLLVLALNRVGSPETTVDWVTFFFVLCTPWLIGQLVRRRIADQAAREDRAAELAAQAVKNELARDLHDIVTHHVTAIVVQADSSAYLEPGDVAERAQILHSIGATGRRALEELRSLLGALEHRALEHSALEPSTVDAVTGAVPRGPAPADLHALVTDIQATGYPVTLTLDDSLELSHAVAVTLYRVAQEATTNAMKHSRGEPISITLSGRGDRVELTVENPVHLKNAGRPGRGRRAMADRLALLGGSLHVRIVDGRYRVMATVDGRAEP